MTEIKAMPDTTTQEVVTLFQKDWVRENNAKEFLSGWGNSLNATILSNRYVAYNGRPAAKIEYYFEARNVRFSGAMVVLFLAEKKVVIGFNYIAEAAFADQWSKSSEEALRSITFYPAAQPPLAELNSTLSARSADSADWEKLVMARWQGKEGWQFVGYTGEGESEVMYFVNIGRRLRKGDMVTIWEKSIPKNPKAYVEQRMRAASLVQRAQVASLTLSFTHQLFSIDCSEKSFRVTQELIYWTNGQTNPVPHNEKNLEVSSPGSMSEMIIDKGCALP